MANERPDFVQALRRADATIAALPPPPQLAAKMRARLAAHEAAKPAQPWVWPFLAVPVAAAAMLFVATSDEMAKPSRDVARFIPATCAPPAPSASLKLAAGCTVRLADPGLEILALDDVALVRSLDGFVVQSGGARFDAALMSTPLTVFVASRRLEAIGARFDVDGDEVRVTAGRVVVDDGRGGRAELGAGDALSWAAPQTWSVERIDAEVRRATRLRIAGEYRRASELLEQLLASPIGEERAAVLSYERAVLLETRLDSSASACKQYATHRARFGRDRYAGAVDAALQRCDDHVEPE